MCIQVNGQSTTESRNKKNGLPPWTEVVLNETFRDFLVAKYMFGFARVAKQCSQCPTRPASARFLELVFRPKIVNYDDGRGIFVAFLVEDIWL